MVSWKRIAPGLLRSPPSKLAADDKCHFVYEYYPNQGYSAGPGNQLVSNFKIEPTSPSYQKRKTFKNRAAWQFAEDLGSFLPKGVAVCFVPTSKQPGHAQYDPRFEIVARRLGNIRPDVSFVNPISMTVSHQSVHTGGDRDEELFRSYLEWVGFVAGTTNLVVVDDVITTGGHFKACQSLIRENAPGVNVTGAFWAVTVHPEYTVDFSGLLFPGPAG
jgi:predicted amidophosphoribosyltransferase